MYVVSGAGQFGTFKILPDFLFDRRLTRAGSKVNADPSADSQKATSRPLFAGK